MAADMRQLIAFPCLGETLVATLDEGPYSGRARTGLLIVSGGNELRIGAHRAMALLAARLAASGTPVLRFDRRGIGDSSGENGGYASSASDIAAAVAALRAAIPLDRVVAFGNCDAATALALFGRAAGIDAVVLANPWVIETPDDLPPPAAIRARYASRLRDPRAWLRLLCGGVDLRKLGRGLSRVARPASDPLAGQVLAAIDIWGIATTIVLARGDATAIAYADAARDGQTRTVTIDTDSHSFARPGDQDALESVIRAAL